MGALSSFRRHQDWGLGQRDFRLDEEIEELVRNDIARFGVVGVTTTRSTKWSMRLLREADRCAGDGRAAT